MGSVEHQNGSYSSDSSSELNGRGASYRSASMISAPRGVAKMRIRGALVPLPIREEEQ